VIPNITRGGRMNGLVAYLVGPGRANEHREPRLIAGDPSVMALHAGHELGRAEALEVGRYLEQPQRAFGTRVTTAVKDAEGVKVGERDAHVWHCSLNLAAEEGVLTDERWSEIATEFVREMGFGGEDGCRWAAVRHGESKSGNDHVHLVVNLVREDGSKANVWNDRPRAQQVCGELELRHGLQVLESRAAGRGGVRGITPAEQAVTERQGDVVPARQRLERLIRGCAAMAADEGEFVRLARGHGVRLRPRYEKGSTDRVAGYSAALAPASGQAAVWFGGGHLARDLTLPRLRSDWVDTDRARMAAVGEWGKARQPASPEAAHRVRRVAWERLPGRARQPEGVASLLSNDVAGWAHAAHVTAGTFAAWSLAREREPGPLDAAGRELARLAQAYARHARRRAPRTGLPIGPQRARSAKVGAAPEAELLRALADTAQLIHVALGARGEKRAAKRFSRGSRGSVTAARAGMLSAHRTISDASLNSSAPRRGGRPPDRGVESER
jgi:Relaxase/Mobilisation nuclease domain